MLLHAHTCVGSLVCFLFVRLFVVHLFGLCFECACVCVCLCVCSFVRSFICLVVCWFVGWLVSWLIGSCSLRLCSVGLGWFRLGSLGFAWIRSGSHGFAWVRYGSVRYVGWLVDLSVVAWLLACMLVYSCGCKRGGVPVPGFME